MAGKFLKFIKNESGATAIEYALIATLISIAIVGGATTLGTALTGTYNTVSSNF